MNKLFKYYNTAASIIIFACLGIVAGLFLKDKIFFLKPIGDIFIYLIKMMLIPIVFFTLVNATARFNEHKNAIQLGGFSFLYFFTTSFLSALFGVLVVTFLTPGLGIGGLPSNFLATADNLKDLEGVKLGSFWDFISSMIPQNVFQSFSEGNILPILFFSIFLGIGISYVKSDYKTNLINNFAVINEVLLWMISKIMYLAPIAVFVLIAYLVGSIGLEIIFLLSKLFAIIIVGLLLWIYVFLGLFIQLFSNISYWKFVKTIVPLEVIAFSTSSSLVSLPKNLDTCKRFGVGADIARFMLPLGATLNMNGSSFYYCVLTLFFAQLFGVHIEPYTYFLIPFTAALASMGTPGIPGLSLTIVMVMIVANVPLIGIPLVIAIDRILDMFITTTNVVGDTCGVLIADRIFGKKD